MKNPIPKVAAIHDLSGFGRSSLTVVIPILSVMGMQVSPLPTAVLSTHSQISGYKLVDLTGNMREFLSHWKMLNIDFNAIYSGFLGSEKQIEIVKDMILSFKRENQLIVVDPVLGDDGTLYGPFDKGMISKMRTLIKQANVITPNLTEAALLLNKPYVTEITEKEIKEWVFELSEEGPETVIITSVPERKDKKATSVIAYNRVDRRYWKVSCDYLPGTYPGTGDAFTSVIVGALLQRDSLPIALDRAVEFVSMGIRATFGYSYNNLEGFLLERVLGCLSSPVHRWSYELLE
jgi:pyridoxine kinase